MTGVECVESGQHALLIRAGVYHRHDDDGPQDGQQPTSDAAYVAAIRAASERPGWTATAGLATPEVTA